MIEAQRVASARRAATVAVVLSITVIPTAILAVATCAEGAAWLLCAEAVALAATSLLIRADLRPEQRHTVK